MANVKLLICIILLFLSSEITEGRPLKQISIAREALEAQFERAKINENRHEWPERMVPAGPDPHHH